MTVPRRISCVLHSNCIAVAWAFRAFADEIGDMEKANHGFERGDARMTYYANSGARRRLTAGLRELADFLDQNPQVPAPRRADLLLFPPDGSDAEMFAEVDAIAEQIGVTASDPDSPAGHYSATRDFGPVQYRAVAIPRSTRNHCEGDE
jgi:hypothetical protein